MVAGAGVVGLTTAAVLRRQSPRARVTILDPALSDYSWSAEPGLRVIALTPASLAVFNDLGVMQTVPDFAIQQYSRMRVWDAATDAGDGIEFSAQRFGREALGAIVDVAALQAMLMQLLESDPAVCFRAEAVSDIESTDTQITITQSDGASTCAALLVGADGRRSRVRELGGLRLKRWSHDQHAVVATFSSELSHEATALQRFLSDGPLALLPLPGGRVSLVWSTSVAHAGELLALDDEAFAAAVTEGSDGVLGALQCAGPRGAFPLESAYVEDPIGPRMVLVGDAAHAIHPLAGQGANLGFSDAVALAQVVCASLLEQSDPGDAPRLRRYRRMRRADNIATLFGLDFINRLFGREHGAFADLRRRGMQWFADSALLQQLAVGHATSMRGVVEQQGVR